MGRRSRAAPPSRLGRGRHVAQAGRRRGKQRIELRTDDLAGPPLAALDESEEHRLVAHTTEISRAALDAGGVTFPNPIGLPDLREQASSD